MVPDVYFQMFRMLLGRNRGDLTHTQWERLQPLLPLQQPKTGRPAVDHRGILTGMLWLLRTGAPWRALPERYGPWRTVASRFSRWRRAGSWEPLFAAVQAQADAADQLNWDVQDVDGPMSRSHQHVAGAKKGRQKPKPQVIAGVASVPQSTCGPKAMAS
jgi:transposase